MPIMDGWEFLEEYKNLNGGEKGKVILVMLTSSLNTDDMKKANSIPEVDGFRNKPLSKEMLESIVDEYFDN